MTALDKIVKNFNEKNKKKAKNEKEPKEKKARAKETRKVNLRSPSSCHSYALYVLKERFELGEKAINEDEDYSSLYAAEWPL